MADFSQTWVKPLEDETSDEYKKRVKDIQNSLVESLQKSFRSAHVTATIIEQHQYFDATERRKKVMVDLIVSLIVRKDLTQPTKDQLKKLIELQNANWTVWTIEQIEGSCAHGWDYSNNGPTKWASFCPTCQGQSQSPIDIRQEEVITDANISRIEFFNYNVDVKGIKTENNGHSVLISIPPHYGISMTTSMHPKRECKLEQIHIHWGANNCEGSEHSIDGVKFSVEIHLAHKCLDNTIAVLAVFGKTSHEKQSKLLDEISKKLPGIQHYGEEAILAGKFKIENFLPSNVDSFFTYMGSLTTPPCSEVVEWTVFAEPIVIHKQTLEKLRNLRDTLNQHVKHNNRNEQSVNGRTIFFRGTQFPENAESRCG